MMIGAVHTQQYSFPATATEEYRGIQIDLLIDRQDNSISLCEMKFYNDDMILSQVQATELRRKRSILQQVTKTKKQVFITLVTTYGVLTNSHSLGLIDNIITMDDLF